MTHQFSLVMNKKGQRAKKKHAKKYARAHSRHSAAGTYIERDANKLPYGTGIWWEQMDREGRGGQSGGGSGGRN